MPKFIIEREIDGAGQLTASQLQDTSQQSCDILRQLGPDVQWIESYVTDNKVYCVYIAPDEKHILDHAERLGLPANQVNKVHRMIDPTTAE